MYRGVQSSRFNSTERWSRRPAIPRDEDEAILRVEGNLAEWGINTNNEAHALFESCVKEVTAKCFNARMISKWKPFSSLQELPTDTTEALKMLLEHNLSQVTKGGTTHTKLETNDKIKEIYDAFLPFPPFYVGRGCNLKLSRQYYELNLSAEELDPLSRFTYTERSVKDYMFEQFSQAAKDGEFPSHFVRALALHEAVKGGRPCLSCKKNGCLRWNSALRSDFCNIVCVECDSVYSLCSVVGSEKMNKVFKNESHFRGSYAHFQQLRALMDEKNRISKMYLLFVTRSAGLDCGHGDSLPVYAAKVIGAQPNLTTDSFCPDHIRIKSKVVFEPMLGKNPWFAVDVPNDFDVVGFSLDVFNRYFDALAEGEEVNRSTKARERRSASKIEQQIVSLRKVLDQIQSIKGKQERGNELQDWEMDLLAREMKVVKKLEQIEDGGM